MSFQNLRWSPNLCRPFLRACEFSFFFCDCFPTSSVIFLFAANISSFVMQFSVPHEGQVVRGCTVSTVERERSKDYAHAHASAAYFDPISITGL